jgi:hypothetical protein
MPFSFKYLLIIFICCYGLNTAFGQHKVARQHTIEKITPAYQQFYSKFLNNQGIPIRSSEVVSDNALILASDKISMMLKYSDNVRRNLVMNGAEFHIIGKDQQTSDLPEFRHLKGVQYEEHGRTTDIDKRTRGMGGIYASCGEENLLKLTSDRYTGYDICVHEFAHTYMDFGLDSNLRKKIVHQHKVSIAKGRWKGVYASTNGQEYWAELSSWYFGAHGDMLPNGKSPVGSAWLKQYDPEGYLLLDSIYTGKLQTEIIKKKSHFVGKGTLSGTSKEVAKLLIINDSAKKLALSRIEQNGDVVLVNEILSSTSFTQDTFFTTVWLIDDGKSQIYIQVYDPLCKIEFSKDY